MNGFDLIYKIATDSEILSQKKRPENLHRAKMIVTASGLSKRYSLIRSNTIMVFTSLLVDQLKAYVSLLNKFHQLGFLELFACDLHQLRTGSDRQYIFPPSNRFESVSLQFLCVY